MKKLKFILFPLVLLSCTNQQNKITSKEQIDGKIIYFKDRRTEVCFAAINSTTYMNYETTSITCVPCELIEASMLKIK